MEGFDPKYIGPFKLISICLIEFGIFFSFYSYMKLRGGLDLLHKQACMDHASIYRDYIKIKIHTHRGVSTASYGINSYGHVLFWRIK